MGAFVAGLLVAFALVVGVEVLSNILHPLPMDSAMTQEEICRHVANYPAWVLAVVVAAWGLTATIGTWIAQRFGNIYSATALGLLLTAAVGFNISMLPYPMWFKVVIMIVIPIAALAGGQLGSRHKKVAVN